MKVNLVLFFDFRVTKSVKKNPNHIYCSCRTVDQTAKHSFPVLSSDILQVFGLVSYYHHGAECTQNLDLERGIILNKINTNADISGRKLAKYFIGLKTSCYGNAENKSFVKSLKSKIDKFPEGEFNHFLQFSLAVIALYLHDEEIPSEYGEKIVQNVFTSKKKLMVMVIAQLVTQRLSAY